MTDPLQAAIEHHRAGRLAEAEAMYRQLLPRMGRDARLLHLLGTLLLQRKQFADAIPLIQGALSIAPNAPQSWFSLAQAMRFTRRFAEAEAAIRRSLAMRPNFPQAHNELGLALVEQGKVDEAIAAWRQATQLKADYGEALSNLAAALAQKKQFADAVEILNRVVQLMPAYPPAHNNLANVLDELDRTDEAIPHWRRAIELQPDFFDALLNLGKTLHQRGEYTEAEEFIGRALALGPNDPHAQFLRGLQHLMRGELVEGFIRYEHRFNSPHFELAARTFPQPRWDGGPVEGRTILLHAEQGLGDTIQFVRYATLLAERGATVIVESPAELATLLASVPGVSKVVSRGEALPAFDVHASVVSLPHLFRTTLETIPANVPYITPPAELQGEWADVLGAETGTTRIGLVWAGNPKHSNDAQRSIPLRMLAPELSKVAGVTYFALQKGPAAEQAYAPGLGMELIDHTDDLHTFADTAAVVSQLDLVIAVDTSVAHLAGAMGKPVVLLLPYVPDWRWLLERDDSPWYPTMTIFRQPARGDWASVAKSVSAELQRGIDELIRV